MLIAVDGGLLPEANEGGRRPATGFATTTGQAVREVGYGAQGNEVNRSLKSVWFAAPPSMGLTLRISSTVRSVELSL